MLEFVKTVPVLAALDLQATLAFYKTKLEFTDSFLAEDYGGVSRDDVNVHFWVCKDRRIAENTSCRIQVKGVDELYEQYQRQDVIHPHGKLTTQPWGSREFAILDNNGNLVWFFESLNDE